jgi:hypothetical protein
MEEAVIVVDCEQKRVMDDFDVNRGKAADAAADLINICETEFISLSELNTKFLEKLAAKCPQQK